MVLAATGLEILSGQVIGILGVLPLRLTAPIPWHPHLADRVKGSILTGLGNPVCFLTISSCVARELGYPQTSPDSVASGTVSLSTSETFAGVSPLLFAIDLNKWAGRWATKCSPPVYLL